ncbi:DNA-processing protein DprA, partial [Mesomycoplasma ovipneumoniae]|uniref:DNA-processing protein DprA n=1 Tax=Mesomycoplasma ovipneumoniae TaxID=29562 RepID=UPI00307FEBF0
MSEALFIAETKAKGGAMITANLGLQYNREVFALPGDISREQSLGCHLLIASHKARIFVDVPNLIATMNWDLQYPTNKRLSSQSASKNSKTSYHPKTAIAKISEHNIQTKQQLALSNLGAELQETYAKLQPSPIHFDELLDSLAYPYAKLSHNLLELELLGLVKS